MKLWYSTTSSFARKVMTILKYHQLEERVQLQRHYELV